MRSILIFLNKLSTISNQILRVFAGIFLIGMILLTCGNILLRMIWVPILGTYELMGYFGAVAAAFSLAYTQNKKGHIAVDILVELFPKQIKKVIGFINNSLCLFFFIIVSWQLLVKGTILLQTGEVTESLNIIYYPFTYAAALGCAVMSLVFVVELIRVVIPDKDCVS